MADNKIVPDNKKEPDHSSYTTTPNDLDPGLTANVVDCSETPKMFIDRVLIDGEFVISNFDVKFPGEFLPMWMIITYLIATLGLYSIILLFRFIRRCCYRNRCCTPDTVHFAFGKMVITNKGRIICWKEEIYQKKIDDKYKDVKQITQFMSNEANCLFCCNEFTCGIEVSFNQYNHGSNHLTVMSPSEDADFGAEAQSAVSSSSAGDYYQWARGIYGVTKESTAFKLIRALKNGLEAAMGATSNLNTIFIVSDTGDRVHNGDIKSILKDMCSIHKQLVSSLPTPKTALVQQEIDPTKFSKQMIKGDFQIIKAGATGSKFEFTEKFTNVTIVKNDGTVSIPAEWVPLLPGEVVLATSGEVPKMNIMGWIKCCCTLGYWYCAHWRRKKFTRSALVLTNKRLITVDIFERSGTVPISLTNFSIQVRSYILGSVKSGFIQSLSNTNLSAGMECDGGSIFIDFSGSHRKALPFAHAMQDFFNGEDVWEPFGQGKYARFCCNYCLYYFGCWKRIPVVNVCSKKACTTMCFPAVPLLFCCCLRPFKIKTDLLMTDMSIIRYARKFNRGICGFLCGGGMPLITNDSFMISWQPINTFQGFNVSVFGAGTESWPRRCCASNVCGRFCCPIGLHEMTLGIDFEGKYQFELKKSSMNKSWVKDANLNATQKLLSTFSTHLQKEYCDQCDIEAGAQTRKEVNHFVGGGGSGGGGGSSSVAPVNGSDNHSPPPPGFVPPSETYAPAGYVSTLGATAPVMEYAMDR